MTTDEMMTIARECASTGKVPKAKVLREFMATLVGAPALGPEHGDPADDAERELHHLRVENAELRDGVERLEAALAALRASSDAFPPGAEALAEAVAHGLPKVDPAALLGLGDFEAHACPALIERTSTGNILLTSVPSQLSPADAMALARDLVREARA